MSGIWSVLDGVSPWWWVALALVLGAIELMTFSYFMLWLAVAALSVAGLLWVFPELGTAGQLGTFAAIAACLTVLSWKLMRSHKAKSTETLNNRAQALIGRQVVVPEGFDTDVGALEIDGIRWRGRLVGSAQTLAPGTPVRVIGAEGMLLHLAPARPVSSS